MTPARPPRPGRAGRAVHRPTEPVEHEIPGADIADLSPAEAGLEMGDATCGQAPQVVRGRAGLARRADRLPLEQVVRTRVGAGLGHAAVRLDNAVPAAHEEQGRQRLAIRRLGEQQPGAAARPVGVPDVAVRVPRSGSGIRPGRPSRGRCDRSPRVDRRLHRRPRTPAERALLTYWRHFLRRSPHSASSSAARSMMRVDEGWIGGAGRQPLGGQGARASRHRRRVGRRSRSRGRSAGATRDRSSP